MRLLKNLTFIALNLVAVAASAGQTTLVPVLSGTDDLGGSLNGARLSSDTVEYIGCEIDAYSNGSITVRCRGSDYKGNVNPTNGYVSPGTCWSTNPKMIDAVQAVNESSNIWYIWPNPSGSPTGSTECQTIVVENGSQY